MDDSFLSDVSQFIPYSSHVHEKVIKTINGEYLVVWKLNGFSFLGKSGDELYKNHSLFNRCLQSLRAPDVSNISFWAHDVRSKIIVSQTGDFEYPFNKQVNDSYYRRFEVQEAYANDLYLTMLYRPDADKSRGPKTIDGLLNIQNREIAKILELEQFVKSTLIEYSPKSLATYTSNLVVQSEILEFFGFLVNRTKEKIPVQNSRICNYLSTSRHSFDRKNSSFSVDTSNGEKFYGTILSVRDYPNFSYPGILNNLKYINCEYVLTQSFTPYSKKDSLTLIQRTRDRMLTAGDKAMSQIVELNVAMDGVASNSFIFGEYHLTLAVYANQSDRLNEIASDVRAQLASAGFISVREDLAAIGSFYAQLPGNWKLRARKTKLTSLNFLSFSPMHNFASGKERNNPWGDAVTTLQSANGQPYYFNFHATKVNEISLGESALANTIIIGKSGTGKTALVNFLLSQVQKFTPRVTMVFFDKDRGAEIFVRASGGRYVAIRSGVSTGFNPLACAPSPANLNFISGLIKTLSGKSEFTTTEENDIARAVVGILDSPVHLRTLTNLKVYFPNTGDDSIFSRLQKWTKDGALGWVFDNVQDNVDFNAAKIMGFDYTELLDTPEVRVPVVAYLIYRMESIIDGRRFIFVMDEFWKILDGGGALKDFARNKLKTIRKQNGFGIFATQSPEDALKSDISAALIEQTATFILLPNPNADKDDYINGLKLTETEFQSLKQLDERSRMFMVKQGHLSSICQLQLGDQPDTLAVISASSENVGILHDILAEESAMLGTDSSNFDISPDQWLDKYYKSYKGFGVR